MTIRAPAGEAQRQGRGGQRALRWYLAAALTIALAVVSACSGSEAKSDAKPLPGTRLDRPAPPFRLKDQLGREVSLDALRGRPVVLTFLYTSCPDFCPLTAEKLRQTAERLGPDAERVAFVAISVDPEGDTPEAARAFSALHRLPEANWHYLVGTEAELAPVWAAYGIGRLPRAVAATPGAAMSDMVGHTEALFILDTQGQERTLLRGDFDPAELATALRTLLK